MLFVFLSRPPSPRVAQPVPPFSAPANVSGEVARLQQVALELQRQVHQGTSATFAVVSLSAVGRGVEVPTVLSPTRIALQIAEQIVGIPVPRGRGEQRLQGFSPGQGSTLVSSAERISKRTVE